MELKDKGDSINLERLYENFTDEEIAKLKKINKFIYNRHGDYLSIYEYDIRFFKHGTTAPYFFSINTYPNQPETILKYLSFYK